MGQLLNFKWLISLFRSGADTDNDPEDLERADAGTYIDAQNLRSTNLNLHGGSIEKIAGEVIQFPNIDNRCINGTGNLIPNSYVCIGSILVLNHKVEFWADELNVGVPYVRVDGWICVWPN